jgi:peptidyl-prolyl cis-trans isomerase D
MLSKLSKFSGGLLSKILLGTLIAIFAVAGMQGLRTPKDTIVSIDGKVAVSTAEFVRGRKNIANSLLNTHPGIDLSNVNLNQLTLNELIKDRLIALELKDLGMYISDDLVISEIIQNSNFHNKKSVFDKDIFYRALSSSGVKEKDFVRHIKDTIGMRFLSKIMRGFDVPDKIVQQLNIYNNQERHVDLYLVKRLPLNDIRVSDEEVNLYYNGNKNRFTNPETRDIEYIAIKPEFFRSIANISTDQINQQLSSMEFKSGSDRGDAYNGLVQNTLEQVMFESIKDIEDSIAEGNALERVAKQYGLKYVKISGISKKSLSGRLPNSRKLIEEAFALEEGVSSEVVQDDAGKEYYIVNTISLKPSQAKPIEEVRKEISYEMKQERVLAEQKKHAYLIKNAVLKKSSSFNDYDINAVKLTRPEQDKAQFGISPEILVEIFNLENVEDLSSVFPTKNHDFAFAKLKSIKNAQDTSKKLFKDTKMQLSKFMDDTVMQSFISGLYSKYTIELFEGNIPQDR